MGVEWSGVEWSGLEWSGMEWSGVEWNGVEWNGMEVIFATCYVLLAKHKIKSSEYLIV